MGKALVWLLLVGCLSAQETVRGRDLAVTADADGSYSILRADSAVLRSVVEADVDGRVLVSSDYPKHEASSAEFHDEFGAGRALTVTHAGRKDVPDLVATYKLYRDQPWGEMVMRVENRTAHPVQVSAIRLVKAADVALRGAESADRILSDSYSEDRPQLAIRDLDDKPQATHRAVGSQLIYNRESGESLFLGALTSDKLLTVFHLRENAGKIGSYDVVSEGTTEVMRGESLLESPASQQVTLKLVVLPGESVSSERLMFAVGADYHAQLENYGRVVRELHHARVSVPTPMGWWSWTAYYFGLNEGAARTNAEWLGQNLRASGYRYFQIDEGYQFARGEYTTADTNLFPHGVPAMASEVEREGLTFGVWTAPFEVSRRAWVYEHHPDWLLHTAAGELIHIGYVVDGKDPLYVLDVTNPGAAEYLRETYARLHDWGVRFVKMDFMDDTAVEGAYYKAGTTAMEAQRIGLGIIRAAMTDDTVFDKDGSAMLNPVGLVDCGRISQDTGHSFDASFEAASGIAARYYMNRNFYIADPDAFSVSKQTVDDQPWHGGKQPMTLDDAKVSIALAAVSGGMFEVGDDLVALGQSPERVELVKNAELIRMVQMGRASTPVDLMTYDEKLDMQPSVFVLQESKRQAIVTVFNWTDRERRRVLDLAALGLKKSYVVTDVFDGQSVNLASGWKQAAHSVRMLRLIDTAVPEAAPEVVVHAASTRKAGDAASFAVAAASADAPVVSARWEFGDGTGVDGLKAEHAYTRVGVYTVRVTAVGVDGVEAVSTKTVTVTGVMPTVFVQAEKKRQ